MSTTDATDYTADIQLMTSVLTGQKLSTTQITGRRRDHVRPFAHLATLLACSANDVVATTGLISPEGLDSIVVVSNSHTDKERTEPFDLQPILGAGAPERTETLSLEEVLNPRPEQNPDLSTHAQRLFDVLKFVDDGTVHPHHAKTWVTSLCWRKVKTRLQKIVTNWSPVSLIDLLKDWDPAPEEISGYLDISGKLLAGWREAFKTLGWLDESGNLPLNTAPRNIAGILEALRTIEDTPSTEELDFVSTTTSILLALLGQDKVKRLFADTSLKNHIKPTRDSDGDCDEDEADVFVGNHTSLLNEEDDFAYRYLLSLTAWSAAIDHLCQIRVLSRLQNCTATVAVVRDDRASSLPDGQFLLDAVEQDARLTGEHMAKSRAEVKEVLRGRIERARAQTRDCHVHAEAGLIALDMHLRKTENSTDIVQRVADVFAQQNTLPIGTSKKCCWACHRLSELLQQEADIHRTYILPGSHGVILPWTPPPFGIPLNILRLFREELKKMIVDWAIAQIDHLNTSRQSPPESGDDNGILPPALPTTTEQWKFMEQQGRLGPLFPKLLPSDWT